KGAPGNPWRSGTLEWAVDSPPSFYNFRAQPYVRHRDPLWFEGLEGPEDQERLSRSEDIDLPSPEERYGVLATRRETLGTSVLEAVPEQRVLLPTPTIVPMVTAVIVGATVLGFMVAPWAAPIGLVFIAAALFVWHRPSADAWDLE